MRHGAGIDPPNRFESIHHEPVFDDFEWDQEHVSDFFQRKIEYVADGSETIISENNSPDIPFRYSINPYRGCAHGCAYCYARPTHEYLGFNAGLDFETKIVVKQNAPELLQNFLARDRWVPEPIVFSGVTDCFQPAEREFQLTRRCLEVAVATRQPIGIITKNALVVRDLDLLADLARDDLVHVFLSITTLDAQLAREMEPRTSIPAARLRAVRMLVDAGVPVGVMVAPIIPGLNDSEAGDVLAAAHDAGARCANYVMLRLPLSVEPVFVDWLRRTQPLRADRVISRIRSSRDGKLSNASFQQRMVGQGEVGGQFHKLFTVLRKRIGFEPRLPAQRCDLFRAPTDKSGQMRLF